mmetsp:Transcript_6047/g.6953  ORF Transcript_6047/g.6953 Transcript_6047/m.6953 type:complete len:304 (-) Transcript_6047:1666-2577(-)
MSRTASAQENGLVEYLRESDREVEGLDLVQKKIESLSLKSNVDQSFAEKSNSDSVTIEVFDRTSGERTGTASKQKTFWLKESESVDIEDIRAINEESFPIKYDDGFYNDVTKRRSKKGRLDTTVAVVACSESKPYFERCDDSLDGLEPYGLESSDCGLERDYRVVGSITGQPKSVAKSDNSIFYELATKDREASCYYILTLAVTSNHRRFGVATELLNHHVQVAEGIPDCAIVYLHVIHYNKRAIHFYEKNGFRCRRRIRNFYLIDGEHYDAFLYAKYLNGSQPPKAWESWVETFVSWFRWLT